MPYLKFTPLDLDPNNKLGVWIWIRIHMDIIGILDPDPHENLCVSETLRQINQQFILSTKERF